MIIKAFNEEETVQAGVRLGAELQSGVFIALYGGFGRRQDGFCAGAG